MNIEQVTVLTTNRCTAECKHCLMNSSPERKEKLSYSKIKYAIRKLLSISPQLKVVIFSGGEATLLKEDLLNAIAFCAENNLLTRLVTNCWWAKSKTTAKKYVQRLRESGLNEINFSVDDYHLPYIDFTHVKNAWQACKNEGFTSVVLASCYGNRTILSRQHIQLLLGESIQPYWNDDGSINNNKYYATDGTLYLISNARLQNLGRARNLLSGEIIYPDSDACLHQACPWVANSIALSPTGDLLACCGIELKKNNYLNFGNIENIDFNNIIPDNTRHKKIIETLRNKGPYELICMLKSTSSKKHIRKKYSSICEICEDIMNLENLPNLLESIFYK